MTEPIEPEDADEGYYWSTDFEEPVKVLPEGERAPLMDGMDPHKVVISMTHMPRAPEHLEGLLIPLDLPPTITCPECGAEMEKMFDDREHGTVLPFHKIPDTGDEGTREGVAGAP